MKSELDEANNAIDPFAKQISEKKRGRKGLLKRIFNKD